MNNSEQLHLNCEDEIYVIKGLVQGVGYRPFVARMAMQFGINGWVKNSGGVVTVRAIGEREAIDGFLQMLRVGPAGARVESIERKQETGNIENKEKTESIERKQETGMTDFKMEPDSFVIIESDGMDLEEMPEIPADLSICEACSDEIFKEGDRRYRYPFNSCTACGPRFSIIKRLPYDRCNITMDEFELCESCEAEYSGRDDRRRHAQTIACPDCGPRLKFYEISGGKINSVIEKDEDCLARLSDIIRNGGVVAIKDIGGYHLVCDPYSKSAVNVLRNIKHRQNKPLAVMFKNVDLIKETCEVNELEKKLLTSEIKPIVLLERKPVKEGSFTFAKNVCCESPYIGAMLPCNAQQLLLIEEFDALVMTSANASGDMMIIDDEQMKNWMINASKEQMKNWMINAGKEQIDEHEQVRFGVLLNNREILTPLDDSIFQVVNERQQVLRSARGLVPHKFKMHTGGLGRKNVLAIGGDLKATFALGKMDEVVLSQNMADLDDCDTRKRFLDELDRMKHLLAVEPEIIVCDEHPGYVSGKMAQELSNVEKKCELIKVYHHHAHVASVMAEHGLDGRVLGVAMDGTGYGEDETVWGAEFLLCEGETFERIGHLRSVTLQGNEAGAKNCENIAAAYLVQYRLLEGEYRNKAAKIIDIERADVVAKALAMGINSVKSSSMGRLFDAVSALLGICMYNSYEGEAAQRLQYLAAKTNVAYPLKINIVKESTDNNKSVFVGDCSLMFRDILDALCKQDHISSDMDTDKVRASLARGFIMAVADYIVKSVSLIQETLGNEGQNVVPVVLSGGTMLNKILLSKTVRELENKGYLVYINEQVPPSDGGLSLGQIYVAGRINSKVENSKVENSKVENSKVENSNAEQ